MRIPPALAADLALLTDALDADGVDIASTVSLLTSAVTSAVSSYHGLSVWVSSPDGHLEMTTLPDQDATARSVTSLRIPVATGTPPAGPSVMIVLYAGLPGAFVDLAADLAWLTGRALDDIGLDADLGDRAHAHPATSLGAQSSINQALGVLVAGGLPPEAALADLDARASPAVTDRHGAALALLDALPPTGTEGSYVTE